MRNAQPLEAEVWGSPDQSASSPGRGTGLEGPGKLGGRPPAPGMDKQSQQPFLLLSLLSLAPLPPISATSHSASAGSAPPAQTLQKQTLSRAVPAAPGGHGGLCGESLPCGWPPPPARRLLGLMRGPRAAAPRRNPQSRGGEGAGDAPGGRHCVPRLQLWNWEAGFTRVRRGIWVRWAPAPPSGDLSLTRLPWPFPLPSLPTSRINYLHPSPYLRVGFWGNASYGRQNDAPQYTHTSIPQNM